MASQGLVHDCLEIRHLICFLQLDRVTEVSPSPPIIDFSDKLGFVFGVLEQIVDDGTGRNGSRIRASKDVARSHGRDSRVIESRVLLLRGKEFRKNVFALGAAAFARADFLDCFGAQRAVTVVETQFVAEDWGQVVVEPEQPG